MAGAGLVGRGQQRRGLRVLFHDEELEALRMLVDHRDELVVRRVQTVNRLQRLLAELTPGQAKKDFTALHRGEPEWGMPRRPASRAPHSTA